MHVPVACYNKVHATMTWDRTVGSSLHLDAEDDIGGLVDKYRKSMNDAEGDVDGMVVVNGVVYETGASPQLQPDTKEQV